MEFPLSHYIPELQRVLSILPENKMVDLDTLQRFDAADIRALQTIVYYTFPTLVSENDYACLNYIIQYISVLMSELEDGAYVIAPGDSPSKIIALINLFFYNPKSSKYEYYIGYPTPTGLKSVLIQKTFTFITFPLSQISYWSDTELYQYVLPIIQRNPPANPRKIVYMDYTDSGTTLRKLQTMMGIYLNNPSFRFIFSDMARKWDFDGDCADLMDILFAEAEPANCRCVPRLYHDRTEDTIKTTRCNMILSLIYLKAIDRLEALPPLSEKLTQEDLEKYLLPYEFYTLFAYDEINSVIQSILVKFNYLDENTIDGVRIDPGVVEFPDISIALGSILSIQHEPIERNIDLNQIGTIGTATLINGVAVNGHLDMNGIHTIDHVLIPMYYIISFVPRQ